MGLRRRPVNGRFFASTAIGAALGVVFLACASDDSYQGGGRRLVPPGSSGDGGITLVPVDSNPPEDTNPPPRDTFVPDTNPPVDAGGG
jgi:hypothetical protein